MAVFNALLAACDAHPHRHIERCQLCAARLEQAAALYRGDFLAQLTLADSAPFEEWAAVQRERLHQSALDALDHLAAYHERSGALEPARRAAARQIELDPWREEAHRSLMRLLARDGQRSAALRQYQVCCRTLAHELDAPPEAQTTALYWRIRDGAPPPAAGVGQLPPHLAGLPLPPSPLVGREEELAALGELLANRACRLLTLHGPGGIGKTRLALAVALQHAEAFEHGVAFVPLEATPAAESLALAILAALDVPVQGQRSPQEQLTGYLRDRELLLVLDSLEHLAAGAGLLAELLQRAPRLTLLVTSQTRLALQAERLFELHGLSCPPVAGAFDLAQSSAARLLVDRMQQAQRMPDLSAEDEQAVAVICRLVAGIPLALELAAAAVRGRSVQEVAAALAENLHILETQWRDVPARHASMAAALEHAWQLLSPDERHVFSRLALFRGGFLAEAAFAVAGATLAVLRALCDQSLLQREPAGRYTVHELVRRFAAEKLAAAGLADETARRHLLYFVALAETAEPHLRSAGQAPWLGRLALEHGNLAAALDWALAHGEIEWMARLSGALGRFWQQSGHFGEGRAWLEAALAQPVALPPAVQAQALYAQGLLLWHQGFYQAARAAVAQSVALWRGQDNPAGLAYGLTMLGMAADYAGAHDRARLHLDESLALFRQMEDPWGLALALFHVGYARAMAGCNSGHEPLAESLALFQAAENRWGTALARYGLGLWAYHQEQFDLARTHLEQALALQREVGDNWLVARTLNFLGEVARCRGELAQAGAYYRQSLDLFRELGAQGRIAIAQLNLGHVALAQGDADSALALFEQALALFGEVEHTWGVTGCVEGMAGVLSARGQAAPAVRLIACTTTLHEAAQAIITPADRCAHQALLAGLRAQLDESAFALAWAEGQQMTLEQAVARFNQAIAG